MNIRASASVARLLAQSQRRSMANLAPYATKYGPGGRSSNSGITATVFGAYGFVGRYFVEELGKRGSRVYIPFRGCEMEIRHLKPMFDLGQLGLIPFSGRDRESIYESVKNSDVVINMIGKHYETKHLVPTRREDGSLSRVNYSLQEVHVDIPRAIAEVCRDAGVQTFIHMSAMSADPDAKSHWSRTKAAGEAAVREVLPNSIIVRPATVFGAEDRFTNWTAEAFNKIPFIFPLVNEGSALVQPVFANDVGKALMAIVDRHEDFEGKTFQLAGPAEYTFKEVAEFVSDISTQRKTLVDVPVQVAQLAGSFVENLVAPVLTKDQVLQAMEDVLPKPRTENLLDMSDLDIVPTSMDKVAFEWLHRFRQGGHFTIVEGYH
ncbi:hypothetical protein B484DRAFT_444236 [Ochromonadaceae sp. CCMP2298]|nr:hypothetical protein B484DRAFT_444236 [Ochromonadaceae sp. CCMP2298]